MTRTTLARHSLGGRLLHALNALVVIVLLFTGLALGGVLTERLVIRLGGHLLVNEMHRLLGLAFVVAWAVLVVSGRISGLLHDVKYFQHHELRWPLEFLRFYLRPRYHPVPFHDGRFDPAQRIIFIALIVALVLTGVSGVYLYLMPPFGRVLVGYAIRIHIAAAWLLIGCLGIHIVAGTGLLRTHRGLIAAMFGNGRVTLTLACTLWPGWARRQADSDSATPTAAMHANKVRPPVRNATDSETKGDCNNG